MPKVEVLLPFRSKKTQTKQVSSKLVQTVFFQTEPGVVWALFLFTNVMPRRKDNPVLCQILSLEMQELFSTADEIFLT